MRLKLTVLALTAGAATLPLQTIAHHSFAAEFDAESPIELTGTVTSVKWTNPHTFFYIDIETENGEYANWALEGWRPRLARDPHGRPAAPEG